MGLLQGPAISTIQREAVRLLLLDEQWAALRVRQAGLRAAASPTTNDVEPVEGDGEDPFADPEQALDFRDVEYQGKTERSLEDDDFLAQMLADNEVTVPTFTNWT